MLTKTMSRRIAFSFFLILLSTLLLRAQSGADLDLPITTLYELRILQGFLYDCAAFALSLGAGLLLSALPFVPLKAALISSFILFWFSTLANLVYFRFFQTLLDPAIVSTHWEDLLMVQGSIQSLAASWLIATSAACFATGLYLLSTAKLTGQIQIFLTHGLKRAVAGLGIFCFALLLRQTPVWFNFVNFEFKVRTGFGTITSSQILFHWIDLALADENRTHGSLNRGDADGTEVSLANEKIELAQTLASYSAPFHATSATNATEWPLLRTLPSSSETTRRWRREFGLPEAGPINVLILFLESIRTLELKHPELAPTLYPRITHYLNTHALEFTQNYSSSIEAAQTVRGQFSVLCSMLPNIGKVAPYIAFPHLRLSCLPEVFKDNGYQTVWINSHNKDFHNKNQFESFHGTERFFDRAHFNTKGILPFASNWGLPDGPVLQESLNILKDLASEAKPFFGHILTISSHHPAFKVPGVELPSELIKKASKVRSYYENLTQLRYVDESVGNFLDSFMKSSLADNTLIVMVGDHSTTMPSFVPLTPQQRTEASFRIPLAFITKNIKNPRKIQTPVHQIDIAPMIATIAGLSQPVSWIGRDALSGQGSPWVYETLSHISYRLQDTACYRSGTSKNCFKIPAGTDPLFEPNLAPLSEDPKITDFFRRILAAQRILIKTNSILPIAKTPAAESF